MNLFGYYTISFETNGGEPVKAIHKRRSELVIMPKTKREGYIFGGWFFDKACTRMAVISTMPREDVRVYAKWNKPIPFMAEEKPQILLPAEAESLPHPRSFLTRLKAGSQLNKTTFTQLCGVLMGYRRVRVRYTKREALFRFGKVELVRVLVRGESLRTYFRLDPAAFDEKIYHHRTSDKNWAKQTPLELNVRSLRSRKYALQLATRVAELLGLQPKAKYAPPAYEECVLARGGNKLTKAGKTQLIAERIHAHDTAVLTDAEAKEMLEYKLVDTLADPTKLVAVTTATISERFADGTNVNLNALKRKGLVAPEAVGFRLVGKGVLERSIVVTADAFNTAAIKMLLLTGGRAIQLKERPPKTE